MTLLGLSSGDISKIEDLESGLEGLDDRSSVSDSAPRFTVIGSSHLFKVWNTL